MQIPHTPDIPPSTSGVDVFTLLCNQSGSLHQVLMRLGAATSAIAPTTPDHWSGPAERAQSLAVAHMVTIVEQVRVMLESAQKLTEAAVWSMRDVG